MGRRRLGTNHFQHFRGIYSDLLKLMTGLRYKPALSIAQRNSLNWSG